MCTFTRVETTIPTFLIKLLSPMCNIITVCTLICIPLVFLNQASSLQLCLLIKSFKLKINDIWCFLVLFFVFSVELDCSCSAPYLLTCLPKYLIPESAYFVASTELSVKI